jgi:hypothetical protein
LPKGFTAELWAAFDSAKSTQFSLFSIGILHPRNANHMRLLGLFGDLAGLRRARGLLKPGHGGTAAHHWRRAGGV